MPKISKTNLGRRNCAWFCRTSNSSSKRRFQSEILQLTRQGREHIRNNKLVSTTVEDKMGRSIKVWCTRRTFLVTLADAATLFSTNGYPQRKVVWDKLKWADFLQNSQPQLICFSLSCEDYLTYPKVARSKINFVGRSLSIVCAFKSVTR